MIKDKLEKLLRFGIEATENSDFGDYSSNVAMIRAKEEKKNPHDLAEQIVSELRNDKGPSLVNLVEKIEVASPGFINFWLRRDVLIDNLIQIVSDREKYLGTGSLKGKKISVEYTDPNPFKQFHIGHLYSNLIGESVARLLEAEGATVWRADFYGDTGLHVAKSVWGMMQKMEEEKVTLGDLAKLSIKEKQEFMGRGYAFGVNKYEEDEKIKQEINEINYIIYVVSQKLVVKNKKMKPIIKYENKNWDPKKFEKVSEIYEAGLGWSLDYFETYYSRLGTKFDGYYPESWVGEYGVEMVEKGLKQGILIKSQGAVVFEGEKYGLHTRVFMNKLGLPTYEAKDLGLAVAKYKDFKYDRSINIFGKEIDEYYKVVRTAMKLIDPELGEKAEYIAHGMVNLPEGKMSSRTGNVITVEWLLDEAKWRLTKGHPMPAEVAEKVGQSAIKYGFLKSGIGQNITFNFEESISIEGNSGPYLQYTIARTNSVIAKSTFKGGSFKGKYSNLKIEEVAILRTLIRFQEVVLASASAYSPNLLCNYLYDLAQKFNTFYNADKIIGSENEDFRLALTFGVGQVLKNGLKLLGIESPDRM